MASSFAAAETNVADRLAAMIEVSSRDMKNAAVEMAVFVSSIDCLTEYERPMKIDAEVTGWCFGPEQLERFLNSD